MHTLNRILNVGLICTGLSIFAANAETTVTLSGSADLEAHRESLYSALHADLENYSHKGWHPKQDKSHLLTNDLYPFFQRHGIKREEIAYVQMIWSKEGFTHEDNHDATHEGTTHEDATHESTQQWNCTKTAGYPYAKLKHFFDRRYEKTVHHYQQLKDYKQAEIDFVFATAFKDSHKLFVLSCERNLASN